MIGVESIEFVAPSKAEDLDNRLLLKVVKEE